MAGNEFANAGPIVNVDRHEIAVRKITRFRLDHGERVRIGCGSRQRRTLIAERYCDEAARADANAHERQIRTIRFSVQFAEKTRGYAGEKQRPATPRHPENRRPHEFVQGDERGCGIAGEHRNARRPITTEPGRPRGPQRDRFELEDDAEFA